MPRISIKDLDVLNCHPLLQKVYRDLLTSSFGVEANFYIITSAFRPNDRGVHGTTPLRGLDVRCHNVELGQKAADYLNARWRYDAERPKKKVAIFHNVGQGMHLHLQVHPNTIEIC